MVAPILYAALLWVAVPAAPAAITSAPRIAAPALMSQDFWDKWDKITQSAAFETALSAAAPTQAVSDALAAGRAANRQPIANVAVANSGQAAAILKAAAKGDADTRAALATVSLLRTTPKMRAAAMKEIPAAERAAATRFSANLSSGVQGLPGIYLDASPIPRGPTPVAYSSVPGDSRGCSSK